MSMNVQMRGQCMQYNMRKCPEVQSSNFESYIFFQNSAEDHLLYPSSPTIFFWTFYIRNIRENEDFSKNLNNNCFIDQTSPTDIFLCKYILDKCRTVEYYFNSSQRCMGHMVNIQHLYSKMWWWISKENSTL